MVRKWPVTNRDHIVISLDSAIKAMDVKVGNYVGEPNYMLYVSLENDTVPDLAFKRHLTMLRKQGFYAYPTDVHAVAISPSESTWHLLRGISQFVSSKRSQWERKNTVVLTVMRCRQIHWCFHQMNPSACLRQ